MGDLVPLGIEVETAVVARGGQPAVVHPHPFLKILAVGHVAVERGFDADAPRIAPGVDAPAADLAADIDDIILGAVFFDQRRQQIDDVAFGHGIEIELHAGIVLHQPPRLDAHLLPPHEFEDRIDVRALDALLPGESPRLDQRFDGHVVAAAAQRTDAVGQTEVEGDMAVNAVGFVAVQTAQQRRGVVDRHRRLGLAVELHDRGVKLLRRDAPHVGRDVQRRAQHHPVHRDVGGTPPAAPESGRDKCGQDSADTLFQHNFHSFSHKSTIFRSIS